MVGSYNTMMSALQKISLYSSDAKNLSTELKAYALLIDEINNEIRELMRECFVCTAESFGLSDIERIIGTVRDELSIEKRREMLMLRFSINSSCFTRDAVLSALKSFGLDCDLYEYPSQSTVVVNSKGEYSEAQKAWIRTQVRKIMPAHLLVQVIFSGPAWSQIDNDNTTFLLMDSKNLTWEEIDNLS